MQVVVSAEREHMERNKSWNSLSDEFVSYHFYHKI